MQKFGMGMEWEHSGNGKGSPSFAKWNGNASVSNSVISEASES